MSRRTVTEEPAGRTKGDNVGQGQEKPDDDVVEVEEAGDIEAGDVEAGEPETEVEAGDDGADDSSTPVATTEKESGSRRLSTPVLIGFLVALLLGISGGAAWWTAAHSDDLEAASDRDAVLVAAKQHIATLNTLDYRKVDAGLKAWTSVTTGTLKDQFSSISADDRKLLADQKKISTGKVVDAAVLEVDGSSARVVASVEVEVRDGKDLSKDPTIKRNRFSADLTRSGGSWKLDTLQQVAVDLS